MKSRHPRLLSEKIALITGNTIWFSQAHLRSSVTTRCVARVPPIDDGETALIVAGSLEEQIRNGELAYVGGVTSDTIRRVGKCYRLPFTDLVSTTRKALAFEVRNRSVLIPVFAGEKFEAEWEFQEPAHWFSSGVGRWAAEYFDGLGQHNHITRANNTILGLRVDAGALSIEFNSAREAIQFSAPVASIREAYDAIHFSKDLGPVLYRLAQVDPIGPIKISGNKHVLVCRYSTGVGAFEIAVPTLDPATNRRDHTLFRLVDGHANGHRSR